MGPKAEKLLQDVRSWPEEDQEELAECAREISARRTGVFQANPDELAGIERGLGDAGRGRFATDEAVAAVRAKFRNP
jgi:predicted transcriptional regulator